jgi:hypothetical protein
MESMANKDKAKGAADQEMNKDLKENVVQETHTRDIAESSAQGEARGNIETNGPYCYHCLTRGQRMCQ